MQVHRGVTIRMSVSSASVCLTSAAANDVRGTLLAITGREMRGGHRHNINKGYEIGLITVNFQASSAELLAKFSDL